MATTPLINSKPLLQNSNKHFSRIKEKNKLQSIFV